jgi:hypothetical protein
MFAPDLFGRDHGLLIGSFANFSHFLPNLLVNNLSPSAFKFRSEHVVDGTASIIESRSFRRLHLNLASLLFSNGAGACSFLGLNGFSLAPESPPKETMADITANLL